VARGQRDLSATRPNEATETGDGAAAAANAAVVVSLRRKTEPRAKAVRPMPRPSRGDEERTGRTEGTIIFLIETNDWCV
jgi:hypothetical protein